jgi:hypothetical protein
VGDVSFFRRGDVNGDATVDLSDAVSTLGFLFLGKDRPVCMDAADANDDGKLDVSDAITMLEYLFTGGQQIPPPLAESGPDPTPDLLGC